MPNYPMLRFVDRPSTSATVRLDLQADPAMVLHDGVSLGIPTLEGDAESVGRAWGYRRIAFTQLVTGSHSEAVPVVTALTRELLRPTNWLEFQLSAGSDPVWFKTYLTQPGEVSFEYVYSESLGASVWQIAVAIDADPFALGALVTLPSVTIGNNPSTGTNPGLYVLPAIRGDAPAPLRIRMTPVLQGGKSMISILGSDKAPATQILPAITAVGGGTSTVAASAAEIGGSYNLVAPDGSNDIATHRMVWSGGAAVPHGTYKALLRMSMSAAATYKIQIAAPENPTRPMAGPLDVANLAGGVWVWVDLGPLDWPTGALIETEFLPATSTAFQAVFETTRILGSSGANLLIDALLLIPTNMEDGSAQTMTVTWPISEQAATTAYVDTETRSVRLISSEAPLKVSTGAEVAGEFPIAKPNQTNVLRILTATKPSADSLTFTSAVVISYHPRYLYLAGS